jgi:hypothetical protein
MDKNFLCEGYAFALNLDCSGIVLNMVVGPEEPSFQKAISWRETA